MSLTPFFSRPAFEFPFSDPFYYSLDPLSSLPGALEISTHFPSVHSLDAMAQMPVTEVKDQPNQFQLFITPPPGINKDDIHVHLENEVLRVKGRHSQSESTANSKRTFHRSFTRLFRVPATLIDDEKITARWNGNRLELDLPKKTGALEEGGRRIAIQGQSTSAATSLSAAPPPTSASTTAAQAPATGGTENKELPIETK